MLTTCGDFHVFFFQFIPFGEMPTDEFLLRLLRQVRDKYLMKAPLLGLAKSLYLSSYDCFNFTPV